jgi:putative inorganic carbon (hco3(-)) transporter
MIIGLRTYSRAARGASLSGQAFLALCGGIVTAFLIASGRWYLAVACLLAVPAYVLIDRYPLAVISIWLIAAPLVAVTESSSTRRLFWIIHRGLPVATLALVVFGAAAGLRSRRLPRLGPAELMMAGYVIATYLSIAYTSVTPKASAYHLYDAVVVPMCLYLLVRLLEPDESALRSFVPAVVFVLLTQAAIGLAAWVAPGALPSEWLDKLGQRTTGSLESPDVYGSVVLFCGLFLLAAALSRRGYVTRLSPLVLFVISIFFVFLTYSRASWLAGLFALVGVLFLARGAVAQLALVLIPIALLLNVSGALNSQVEFARDRLNSETSEESALSRLPVAYASVRMFEAKPLFGFGYENFNRFDYSYQRRVGNLVYPQKDHSSHNLYLTLLAEQGLVGFALYVGPALWWLGRTKSRWRSLPRSGLVSRKLVGALWLAIAGHVIVNNFSRMQIPFGLGIYWLSLGLIASLLSRQYSPEELARPDP